MLNYYTLESYPNAIGFFFLGFVVAIRKINQSGCGGRGKMCTKVEKAHHVRDK